MRNGLFFSGGGWVYTHGQFFGVFFEFELEKLLAMPRRRILSVLSISEAPDLAAQMGMGMKSIAIRGQGAGLVPHRSMKEEWLALGMRDRVMKVPFGVVHRLHFPSERVVQKQGNYEETLVPLLT